MRKYFLLAAAIVFGLQACDPSEKGGQTDGTVAVTSFGFYAEDNPDALQADYVVENPTSSVITVRLPYGLDETVLESLVPRFEVTPGAVVYAGGTVVESGKTALDFSSAVDLIVSSGDANAMYTVNVIIAEKLSFTKVASAENASYDFVMGINPADGLPYIFGTAGKYETNADGEEEKVANIPVLYAYDGAGALTSVAGNLTSGDSECLGLNFSPEGTAYVAFNDGSAEDNVSVMKIDGNSAVYVGQAGSLPENGGGSTTLALSVIPVAENDIYFGGFANVALGSWARRQLCWANSTGSSWTTTTALDGWPSSGYAYVVHAKQIDGIYYLFLFNYRTGNSYMYRYDLGKWTCIFRDFIPNRPDGQPITISTSTIHCQYGCMDFDVDSKGNIYLLYAAKFTDDAQFVSPAVIRYDVEAGSQTIIGGVMTDFNGGNDTGGARYLSLALNDADVPYVLLGNALTPEENPAPVYLTWIDPDTRQWVDRVAVASCNAGAVCIRFADNGTGYIGVYNEDASTYDLYESVAE